MGAVAEEMKTAWSFVLKQIRNGDNDWDQVTELVEKTLNVITVLENINASFLDAFGDVVKDSNKLGGDDVLNYPRHVSQVMQDFDAQLRRRTVQGVKWEGKPFQVMPFTRDSVVDVEAAKLAFVDCKKGVWFGEVFLHYAPIVNRVLVSVDGTHFIGCIAGTRTMDALEMIALGDSGTIYTTGYLNSTGKSVKVGVV
jgi:hypothetical protein